MVTDELAPEAQLLKLQAAILLATNKQNGFIKLYSFPYKHQLIVEQKTELNHELVTQDITYKKNNAYRAPEETIPEFDMYENAKGASLPLLLGGTYYNAFDNLIVEDDFKELCNATEQYRVRYFKSLFGHFVIEQSAKLSFSISEASEFGIVRKYPLL